MGRAWVTSRRVHGSLPRKKKGTINENFFKEVSVQQADKSAVWYQVLVNAVARIHHGESSSKQQESLFLVALAVIDHFAKDKEVKQRLFLTLLEKNLPEIWGNMIKKGKEASRDQVTEVVLFEIVNLLKSL